MVLPIRSADRDRQVDGLSHIGIQQQNCIDQLAFLKIPTLPVDPKITNPTFYQVLIDSEHGAHQATRHLFDHRHSRIGLISVDLDRLSFRQRIEGYAKALIIAHLTFHEELGRKGGQEKATTISTPCSAGPIRRPPFLPPSRPHVASPSPSLNKG